MNRYFKMAALLLLSATLLVSCTKKFKTSDNGLTYKFLEENKKAAKVEMGDVIVGTCTIRLEDSLLAQQSSPERIFRAGTSVFKGDLNEGLMMMHKGDSAIFAIPADSMAAMGQPFPPYYKPGTGMKVYFEIRVVDIVTNAEIQQEQNNLMANMQQQHEEEMVQLAQYAQEHGIKEQPTEEGLYIVVNKKGNGQKVEIGRDVAINYTGRLLDGKVFDTSIEKIAKENNLYNANRPYEPLAYKVGEMSLIRGWEMGILNQPAGSKLTLIIPSSLGYGPRQNGNIPANSPLLFDIEIVSVK